MYGFRKFFENRLDFSMEYGILYSQFLSQRQNGFEKQVANHMAYCIMYDFRKTKPISMSVHVVLKTDWQIAWDML